MRNRRNGLVLAERLEAAFDSAERRKGLLGRAGLDAGTALVIAPSNAVHTFFMRFSIDVLFVRRNGQVIKVSKALPANRIAVSFGAFAVVEVAAGGAARADVQAGDWLIAEFRQEQHSLADAR